jgi:hypothetical protein
MMHDVMPGSYVQPAVIAPSFCEALRIDAELISPRLRQAG